MTEPKRSQITSIPASHETRKLLGRYHDETGISRYRIADAAIREYIRRHPAKKADRPVDPDPAS